MGKKKKKQSKNLEKIAMAAIFIAGLIMIVLFIYLMAIEFNKIPLMPADTIYNNPGVHKEDEEEETTEEATPETEDDEETPLEEDEVLEIDEIIDENPEAEVQGVSTGWWSYPENIYEIPINAVTLTSVVDKGNKLKENYVPDNLVADSMAGIGGIFTLTSQTRIALADLVEAAKQDGITNLVVVSSYRSYQTQQGTYNYWVSYNGGLVDVADKISARPGHSEHQLGTVVDFATTETKGDFDAFQYTEAYQWLLQNGETYGFRQSYPSGMEEVTGYSAEAWHWRWWGE